MPLKIIWMFLSALPDIIKLLGAVQKAIDESNANRKAKDDIKSIHSAISSGDASKLDAIFGNVPAQQLPVNEAKAS